MPQAGRGQKRELLFNVYRVSVASVKKVLERDSSDSCATVPELYTIKMIKIPSFCINSATKKDIQIKRLTLHLSNSMPHAMKLSRV